MTLVIKSTRKVVVIGWDTTAIQGKQASLSATGHDGVEREVRNTENDGAANLYFPADYEGNVEVTVRGSKSGEDTATLQVT